MCVCVFFCFFCFVRLMPCHAMPCYAPDTYVQYAPRKVTRGGWVRRKGGGRGGVGGVVSGQRGIIHIASFCGDLKEFEGGGCFFFFFFFFLAQCLLCMYICTIHTIHS